MITVLEHVSRGLSDIDEHRRNFREFEGYANPSISEVGVPYPHL